MLIFRQFMPKKNATNAMAKEKWNAGSAKGKASGKRPAELAMASSGSMCRASSPLKGARAVEAQGKKNLNAALAMAREKLLAASAKGKEKFNL